MTTQDTATTSEVRDNIYWPDEAQIADFVEQVAQAKNDQRQKQADSPFEDNAQHAMLYFVS